MFLRSILISAGICLLVIGGWFFVWQKPNQSSNSASLTDDLIQARSFVEINDFRIYVNLAETEEERRRGLSGRVGLAENQGMLFLFSQSGFHSFWMKEMLFPIDIIWFDQNKEVVFIKENFLPCRENNCQSIRPDKKAKYVLEIKAGVADKFNIKIGDKLTFKIDKDF